MKRILAVLLAMSLLLSCCPVFSLQASAATSGTCGDNLTWTLDDEGTLTISGTGAIENYSSYSSIPWYSNRNSIKTVIIQSGVTTIGNYAFSSCTSLTSVIIPNSVTSIGDSAFDSCDSLTSVTIPDSVTTIGEAAFAFCGLTSVIIPESVTSIGLYAFIFNGGLMSICVDENNPAYSSDSYGVLFNKEKTILIDVPDRISGSYTIPDTVTTVEVGAFRNCSLTVVDIPDSVTAISDCMFFWCFDLSTVNIPAGVTSIGSGAFDSCESLTSVTIPDSVATIGEAAFYYCDSLVDVYYEGSAAQWAQIVIGANNEELTNATLHTVEPELTGITVKTNPTKTAYWIGESFDTTGLVLDASYSDGTTTEITEGFTVSGFDSATAGTQTITVTYEGFTTAFDVSVINTATEGYFTYTVLNGEATITDCDTAISGDITIPATLGGYPVTAIGERAFYERNSLTSITIPDSVVTIGERAFESCLDLTLVTISDSVTTIGDYAFYNCGNYLGNLFSVTIGNSVTTIGDGAFSSCVNLTEITIPDSVTTIGDYAFHYCPNLTSVTIGEGVTTIGAEAFSDCGMTSVTIPANVTDISATAFRSCENLSGIWVDAENQNYSSDAYGVVFNKDGTKLIMAPCAISGSYTIPEGSTEIGWPAFAGCSSLTSVTIPDSVTTIDVDAFADCSSLTDIYYMGVQQQWEEISNGQDYEELYNVTVHIAYANAGTCGENVKWRLSYDGVLTIYGTGPMSEYYFGYLLYFQEVVIESGVTTICANAFRSSSLSSITIPDSVQIIGCSAFDSCDDLTSVIIPDSVTTIEAGAFWGCKGLQSVELGASVKTIGYSAFAGCSNLTFIAIPEGINAIEGQVFWECSGLTAVAIPASVTTVGLDAFSDCAGLKTVYYSGSQAQWEEIDIVTGNDPLTAATVHTMCIDSGVCGDNVNWGLTSDGTLVVSGTGPMTDYTEPDTPWNSYCEQIKKIVIDDGVTTIGVYAFNHCENLTSVTIGKDVTTIAKFAFANCDALTEITLGNNITTVSDWAFLMCDKLNFVTIGESVTAIGIRAFRSCYNLTSIWVDENNPNYSSDEHGVLFDKDKTTLICAPEGISGSYAIPNGVTNIGEEAFCVCEQIALVYVPVSVKKIGENAFTYCHLKDVYYRGTKNQWDIIEIANGNDPVTAATLHVYDENDVIVDNSGNAYETLTDAIKNIAADSKLTVLKDIVEDVTVSKSVSIDLNGYSITGTLTIEDGCILYGMDIQTDDFTINDEFGYGKIQNVVLEGTGKLLGAPAEDDRHGYMMITEKDGVSFHCVNLKLKSMTLRAESTGVYFKSDFAGDELVAENVKQFGVALSVKGMPTAENMEADCLYSEFYDFNPGSNGGDTTSTLLKGIMKQKNAALLNNRNANMPVYGRAYILTNDGQYIFGASASRSLRQQVEAIDTAWDDLSAAQQAGVQQMYADFANVMKSWNIPNLKASIA